MRMYRFTVSVLLLLSAMAHALEPQWGDKKYGYFSSGESLHKILTDFSASYGIPADVSEGLNMPIRGKFTAKPPKEFLESVSAITNMRWYYDGYMLFFYRTDETERAVIKLKYISARKLHRAVKKLPWWQKNSHWSAIDREGMVFVSGAPQFVKMLKNVAKIMDEAEKDVLQNNYIISVFPLKHASAADYEYSYRGQTRTIPGVASILKNSVKSGGSEGGTSTSASNKSSKSQSLRSASSMNGLALQQDKAQKGATVSLPNEPIDQASGGRGAMEPFVRPDHRLNAVVIGDFEANMKTYKNIIKSLDYPLEQIEIDVTIVNIQSDDFERLGVDWEFRNGDYAVNLGNANIGYDARTELTLIPGAAKSLLTRIELLATDGRAKITSQPSVMTLNNFEAVLDNSRTFYVRLAGREVVDLFPVTVGTLLRVTPYIQRDAERTSIRLDIQIEDGQQDEQTVDRIPVVKNTVINTQSLVNENESLLVGGYYYDAEQDYEKKVPVFHKIPVVGNLFKSKSKTLSKMVRLFLISPRIVGNARPKQAKTTRSKQ